MKYIFFVTSILGALRDYSKFKVFNIYKFMRSPIITQIIYCLLQYNKINYNNKLISIILERWLFLILKTIQSIYNDDYNNKKEKYKIKYKIKY